MLARSPRAAACRSGRLRRWAATQVATIVSTYALDAACTAGGRGLAANWRLLEATSTSTSALSKLDHHPPGRDGSCTGYSTT